MLVAHVHVKPDMAAVCLVDLEAIFFSMADCNKVRIKAKDVVAWLAHISTWHGSDQALWQHEEQGIRRVCA